MTVHKNFFLAGEPESFTTWPKGMENNSIHRYRMSSLLMADLDLLMFFGILPPLEQEKIV